MRRSPARDEGQAPAEVTQPDPWQTTSAHLRVPMTLILGRSQLLERQIRIGQVWDAAACLETLAAIAEAVHQMETRLREAETGTSGSGSQQAE